MKTVLAIVASPQMGRLLQRSLGKNYSLTVCYTAQEGEALLKHYDGLILELSLPGCNGLDFLEQNRASLPPVVIALTFVVTRYVAEAAHQVGVDALIRMPCTGNAIARSLNELIRKKAPSLSGG